MNIKFKLLLNNLNIYNDYHIINYGYLSDTLGCNLIVPNANNQLFIFSCFALSIDGKICYNDNLSGFSIAQTNKQAQAEERYADWWYLNLARAISDAVIVGTNSLINEDNNYVAQIDIAELINLRQKLNKPDHLHHIIICRDLNKVNWHKQQIIQQENIPLVIFTLNDFSINNIPSNLAISNIFDKNINKQIIKLDKLDIQTIIHILKTNNITTILNESPYFHHELLHNQLLNEAWINTSTVYIGGDAITLGAKNTSFTSYNHPHCTIVTLHNIGYNFLYTRYKIDYATH